MILDSIIGIGSLLGSAAGLFSKNKAEEASAQAMQKARSSIMSQRAADKAAYSALANQDFTQRADAQALLNKMKEQMVSANRSAAGTAAVMGSGGEAVAAQKEASSKAMADLASSIAADGAKRRDEYTEQGILRDGQYQQQLAQMDMQRASTLANNGTQALKAFSSAGSALDDWLEGYASKNKS